MRKPISSKQNIFFNGEAVDDSDLTLEQDYNNAVQTGLINNHIGTGILPENLIQVTLFDSDLASGLLDGKAINTQAQPTDVNYGNQLEIEVQGSLVAGKRAIKLLVIGLDFQNNLQYERFTFNKNEKQLSSKHYIATLTILFNDFIGDPIQSLNLGGRILIKEAKPLSLMRDCVMVAQDLQPNIFFRDFFVSGSGTLNSVLVTALPNYNIDTLNITADYKQLRDLVENDVSSQIGQKFLATTNNIQKISLLLAVTNSVTPSNLVWTGDLIISIFQLQSALDCPLDIAPGTAIDFDPSNIPLAQLSLNYTTLLARGVELGETPQPIDFIFSNTPVGAGSVIKTGSYYVVTIKRAGDASVCALQAATGTDRLADSKITFFNGAVWVDVPDEDLWFQVWTDSAQVSDGQAYDAGHGIIVPKTETNETTGLTEDVRISNISFVRNDIYYGIVEAITEKSALAQDQRTGGSVLSQQQFVPQISLITVAALSTREAASDPLIIGNIADKNAKAVNAAVTPTDGYHFGMIKNQWVIKVIDDPLDSRYNLDVINLITELTGSGGVSNINGLLNGKFVPNTLDANTFYRIADTEILSMLYGDLNGDGVVDADDLLEIQALLNSDLNTIPSHDDYVTLTTPFKDDTGLTWDYLDEFMAIIASGTDGILTVNPQDSTQSLFSSASAAFTSSLIRSLRITGNISNPGNNGTFAITEFIDVNNIDIQKTYYTSDTILKILRADINGDMIVDVSDYTLISNYIDKVAPFPEPSSPGNKIGTEFIAIRLTVEQYVDRADEYTASITRAADVHPLPDILIDGYLAGFSLFGTTLTSSPVSSAFTKQLGWYNYLVNATSNPKLVPTSFNYQSDFVLNSCALVGIADERYPLSPTFDPGRNDIFVPNNLVVNDGGQVLRPDGSFMKVDFEISTVVLEIPTNIFTAEKTINIFTDFIADYTTDGRTRLGYEAMRFADCSTVTLDALNNEQIRFAISLRSFSPGVDGSDISGYEGIIVDGKIGVAIDATSGILTLNFNNLYEDPILQTLKTRVQITAYLKKAGFNNEPLTVDSTQVQNLLELTGLTPIGSPVVIPNFCGSSNLTEKSINGAPVTLLDFNSLPFNLQNGKAYALNIVTVANAVDGYDGRAMWTHDLLMHCTSGTAVIDNTNTTLVVLNGTAWDITFTVIGNTLVATFTGTVGENVEAVCCLDWVTLGGGI